jgi:hypothetical protein
MMVPKSVKSIIEAHDTPQKIGKKGKNLTA